jgi:hypothetical protein
MEIDLLRWGQRTTATLPARPCHILVSRADQQPETWVWSFAIDSPIPDAPLPLIDPAEQVPLPLQAAFTTIYEARRFRSRLDYSVDPAPPLNQDQRQYIDALLKQSGLRS